MSSTAPSLSEKWETVLGRVELMLEESLTATSKRLAVFTALADSGEVGKTREEQILRLNELCDGLQQRQHAAEMATAEVDLALVGNQKIVGNYLAQAEELRQKLASAGGGAIG